MAHPRVLQQRYGKAHGAPTPADKIDLEACREGIQQLREHPESAIPIEEVMRRYGIK